MLHEGFRVPDKVFWVLAIIVTALTWGSLIYIYRYLPSPIPTHFGVTGHPDVWSPKSWGSVFAPALVQAGVVALLGWVYRHPQYSHIPSSMAVSLFPEPWKTRIMMVMRHMIVMLTLIISLIFAYVVQGTVATAFGLTLGLSSWTLAGLFVLLFVLIVVYTAWLYRWSKEAVAAIQHH